MHYKSSHQSLCKALTAHPTQKLVTHWYVRRLHCSSHVALFNLPVCRHNMLHTHNTLWTAHVAVPSTSFDQFYKEFMHEVLKQFNTASSASMFDVAVGCLSGSDAILGHARKQRWLLHNQRSSRCSIQNGAEPWRKRSCGRPPLLRTFSTQCL